MTERELREIKRRFRPERSNISKIVGCFVNENRQIIYRINQPVEFAESELSERLLKAMKKVLSGTLGTTLTDISFSTKQVLESEEHALLMKLRESHLSDAEALEKFYSAVVESLKLEGNYVILLANDLYDVFEYSKDGEKGESSEVFSYLVCAVCPIKSLPEALTFKEADSLFHPLSLTGVLGSAELGFMFPSFDDRRTNIYNALFYSKDLGESYPEFNERIFSSASKMPPKAQKETFAECLSSSLGEECSYEVVRALRDEVAAMIEVHKESKDPEPLTVTKTTVAASLERLGVDGEKINKLRENFDESFGTNAELSVKNILPPKKLELQTPDVKIKVSSDRGDLVSTQVINGTKYVMIKVEGTVEVNGINLSIED